ncbi:hypothetical protein [Blastomonas fulva]|uniref:Ribbon-helix-helix protein CopG domain-containing protein n=1 Tax=Blastomonas fulva TaxID=1550728 RepID=A0ABM6M2R6_9SPHN|nr:hypothetical protein [Blastomonas fulva]ASR50242.1 hypothetical protein B5J99_01110 [Blastomonas fulva]
MKPVQYTVRLPATLNKALRKLAEQQGITPYAALRRSVVAGINAQANAPNPDAEIREMVAEVAAMGARLADLERMVDRTLFTACAAYCYARNAAAGGGKTDDIVLGEINRAYDRQRALAEGRS